VAAAKACGSSTAAVHQHLAGDEPLVGRQAPTQRLQLRFGPAQRGRIAFKGCGAQHAGGQRAQGDPRGLVRRRVVGGAQRRGALQPVGNAVHAAHVGQAQHQRHVGVQRRGACFTLRQVAGVRTFQQRQRAGVFAQQCGQCAPAGHARPVREPVLRHGRRRGVDGLCVGDAPPGDAPLGQAAIGCGFSPAALGFRFGFGQQAIGPGFRAVGGLARTVVVHAGREVNLHGESVGHPWAGGLEAETRWRTTPTHSTTHDP
jgi:hypothetical protein